MLPFLGKLTILDYALNLFVVILAPLLCVKDIIQQRARFRILSLIPLIILFGWVAFVILLWSPPDLWPSRSALITIGLSLLLCSQIGLDEVHCVRRAVLLITALFCVCVLCYGRDTLRLILSGSLLDTRLGAERSAANLVAFPRIMYVLIATCIVTMVVENKKWIRIAAAGLMPIPFIIGIASGARGPLFALIVALSAFVLNLKRKVEMLLAAIVLGIFGVIGYNLFLNYFPLQESRLMRDNRSGVWEWAMNSDLSILGQGILPRYPHNIFLEFLLNYGLMGLTLFLIALFTSVISAWMAHRRTGHREILWVMCLLILQMTAQQFSLNIYFAGSLWAAIALPLGLLSGLKPLRAPVDLERNRMAARSRLLEQDQIRMAS